MTQRFLFRNLISEGSKASYTGPWLIDGRDLTVDTILLIGVIGGCASSSAAIKPDQARLRCAAPCLESGQEQAAAGGRNKNLRSEWVLSGSLGSVGRSKKHSDRVRTNLL